MPTRKIMRIFIEPLVLKSKLLKLSNRRFENVCFTSVAPMVCIQMWMEPQLPRPHLSKLNSRNNTFIRIVTVVLG